MIYTDWFPIRNKQCPLYKQIFFYIRNKILSGSWPIGSKLPPQRQLATDFKVNRSTIRIAIDELIAEGFLTCKIGSGIWVSNNTWSKYANLNPINWNNYIQENSYLSNFPLIQEINRLEFNPNIIRLGTGELSSDLLPHNELKTLILTLSTKINFFGYEEPKGLLYLREQISKHLTSLGINVSPNSILIVSGALQALQLILFGLLPSVSNLYFERPSYLSSLKLMQSVNANFFEIPLDNEGIDLSSLTYQYKHAAHSLLYTIPTFHNPTGIVMSLKRRKELLDTCQKLHLPILEDDVYRDLWFANSPPPPLKALDKSGNVLYVDSMSKTVGPGIRIGWIVGPEPVIDKLADLKMQNDYGSSCLSQWLAAEWFASNMHDQHLKKLRQSLSHKRKLTIDLLQEHFNDIATWKVPEGGFYIWLKLNRPIAMTTLFKSALRFNILLNPGNLYDNLSNTHLRISFAYASPLELQFALPKLAELIRKPSSQSN